MEERKRDIYKILRDKPFTEEEKNNIVEAFKWSKKECIALKKSKSTMDYIFIIIGFFSTIIAISIMISLI